MGKLGAFSGAPIFVMIRMVRGLWIHPKFFTRIKYALGIKGELLSVTSLPLPAAMTFHQLRLRNPMATQDAGPKSHPQRVTGRVRGAVRLLRPCRFLDHLCPPQSCASTASCRDSGLPFEGPRSLGVTSARAASGYNFVPCQPDSFVVRCGQCP